MNLSTRDKKIIWHPFTQEQTAQLPLPIKKAQGSYLYDYQDKSYLDLISSWWVNLHGHAHPEIAKAIYQQALSLEHVIFAGFTHEPAVKLCEELQNILPSNLQRFFFSDNGSTAVEVALKMAYQYWYNQGEKQRSIFMSFDGGYHGDTFGAMSVGKKSGFHNQFNQLLFEVLTIPYPATWDNDAQLQIKEQQALYQLDTQLKSHGQQVAAIILEPLIQGASGMRMCRPQFIQDVVRLVKKYDILVIFDEIMTGFGRTGTNFACDQINIAPDFICLSKGITGGFLPLAVTVTTNHIYQAFLSQQWDKAFAHGHSYTANPIACAAGVKSLELLLHQETQNAIQNINKVHRNGIKFLNENCRDKIKETRIQGTIAAFALNSDINKNSWLKTAFLEQGLLIRPLGNTIYLLPPYSVNSLELNRTYQIICEVITRCNI
ncbi:MAG: adenosylmethionine--8-amino-7-oxononanoate transaminase [Rickettsiaceae bacterium]